MSPFITAIATVLLVWVAIWQWDTSEKADQTNREINRAFVKGKGLLISQPPLYWMFQPVIENTGNTQAKNLEVFVDLTFKPDEINLPPPAKQTTPRYAPIDPELAYEKKKETFPAFSRIPLGAKAETIVGGGGILASRIDEMAKNRSDGYISGVIWYDDVFLKSERHKAKFCFVIQPVKRDGEATKITYGLCQFWNCSDDECIKHKKDYDAEAARISFHKSN